VNRLFITDTTASFQHISARELNRQAPVGLTEAERRIGVIYRQGPVHPAVLVKSYAPIVVQPIRHRSRSTKSREALAQRTPAQQVNDAGDDGAEAHRARVKTNLAIRLSLHGIRCALCNKPAGNGTVVLFGGVPTFPICAACSLPDNAPCSHCRHTLIEHVGVPDVCPEFAAMADCDARDCSCARFVRGLRR